MESITIIFVEGMDSQDAVVKGGVVTRTGSVASLRKGFGSRLLGRNPRDSTAYEFYGQVICASVSSAEV